MRKLLLIVLIVSNSMIGYSQDTIRLTVEDSTLIDRFIENANKIETLSKKLDSISYHSDSVFNLSSNSPVDKNAKFDYEEVLKKKSQFDNLYSSLIHSDNFPNTFPIEKINKSEIIGFGAKLHPIFSSMKFHQGIDIPAGNGENVKSTISGTVLTKEELKSGYGNYLIIESNNQISILLAHLDTIYVKQGDRIEKGQVIGTVGSSGMSTGNHLHYEIHIDKEPVNPIFATFNHFDKNELVIIYTNNTVTLD